MTEGSSARLALPMLFAGQAQKEITHNEALARLDLAIQASAIAIDAEIPPGEPEPGDCWILGETPEGAWSGHALALAGWTDGGWRFVTPFEGMSVLVTEVNEFAVFLSGSWTIGELRGRLFVDGEQVVGPRVDAIPDPIGGVTIDAEARTAIATILDALRAHGLVNTA